MKRPSSRRQGFALILVVFMVVIVTILLVGFVLSMQLERMASSAMAGNERAKIIAQDALEHATALLDNNIPQPIPPGTAGVPENWIISPGLLTKFPGADSTSTGTYIPLSTDALDGTGTKVALPTTDYVNLNAQELSTGNYPIIPTGEPVPMSWVYLLQDPSSPASATNPIVGRYAFWMDDENARININTAYGKSTAINLNRSNPLDQTTVSAADDPAVFDTDIGFNSLQPLGWATTQTQYYPGDGLGHTFNSTFPPTYSNAVGNPTSASPGPADSQLRYYPLWHPSAINLDLLPTSLTNPAAIGAKDLGGSLDRRSLADWVYNKQWTDVHDYTQNWRLLQNPSQIQPFITSASPGPANFYQANEFNLTAYNRAPEFNAFGKPRLLLEDRIQSAETQAAETETASVANDSMKGNFSGAELEFYTTPDLDPQGPMYFHGDDQEMSWSPLPANWQYADLDSVQMVGDYLSNLLNYTNWPGMPAGQSFVTKWTPSGATLDTPVDIGKREADQVAWNIVSMGNYAPSKENGGPNTGNWPDQSYPMFTRTENMGAVDKKSPPDTSPSWPGVLSNQPTAPASGWYDPDRFLRVGKLSGKAIMPYAPKPYLNEISLVVEATPVPGSSPPQVYLKLFLQLELYANRRGPPGTFWNGQFNPSFALTHFFYQITDNATPISTTAVQAADGNTSSGGDEGAKNANDITDAYSRVVGDHTTNAWIQNANKTPYIGSGNAFLAGAAADPGPTDVVMPVDSYLLMTTTRATSTKSGNAIYACTGTAMQTELANGAPPATAVKFSGSATSCRVQANARIVLYANQSNYAWEIVPVWDAVDSSLNAMAPPPGQGDSVSWDFNIDLTQVPSAGTVQYVRSLEIKDARLGGNTTDAAGNALWVQNPAAASVTNPTGDASPDNLSTPAAVNSNAAALHDDSYGYYDFQNLLYPNSPRPSIGFLSCVPTGQQRGIADSTFVFGPSATKNQLPDWLILDIVAPSFYDHLQDSPAPYSYLHSTMGKINLNANLYPAFAGTSGAPVSRNLPLEALFKNMVPDANLPGLVSNIMNHTLAGQDFGAQGQYDYIGELCEVKGVADGANTPGGAGGTNWQKMALIRNLANLLTTQSNTFHVWGAAQAIKVTKGAGNTNYAVYNEPGDTVTVLGEKRFESVIERSVWPGVDGVPGNGHVNANGAYDRMSASTGAPVPVTFPWAAVTIPFGAPVSPSPSWAQFDGPDNPNQRSAYPPTPGWYGISAAPLTWTKTLLLNANNPARAHMTYKPIMFRYITE